ncbi:nuclear transport factor 2 family protein [bacterium]|nr:nuclear transport factor 2 family protein [bacterium]
MLKPPFDLVAAQSKVQVAQDLWNTRDPAKVVQAYTLDSQWRNRHLFLKGRDEIEAFLHRKWERELDYRLRKELFLFSADRIAVQFAYEWHDASGNWFRSHGLEHWEFASSGLMSRRTASINDVAIQPDERQLS